MEKPNINRYEFLWKTYTNIQENIRSLDNKIFIQMVIAGMILSFVISNFGNNSFSNITNNLQLLTFILCFMFFLVFTLFIIISILVLLPRKMKKVYPQEQFIFFEGISYRPDAMKYFKEFTKASDDDLLNDLITQIYIVSKIARLKLKLAALSFYLLIAQFIIFSTLILVKLF